MTDTPALPATGGSFIRQPDGALVPDDTSAPAPANPPAPAAPKKKEA